MSNSATKKLVLTCLCAALGVAAAFWVVARAVAGRPFDAADASDSLALDFAASDVASIVLEIEGEASGRHESEGPSIVKGVVEALGAVRLGEKTDVASSDSVERLVFRLRDGSERSYAFEGGNYLGGDTRITLRAGSRELAKALRALTDESQGGR